MRGMSGCGEIGGHGARSRNDGGNEGKSRLCGTPPRPRARDQHEMGRCAHHDGGIGTRRELAARPHICALAHAHARRRHAACHVCRSRHHHHHHHYDHKKEEDEEFVYAQFTAPVLVEVLLARRIVLGDSSRCGLRQSCVAQRQRQRRPPLRRGERVATARSGARVGIDAARPGRCSRGGARARRRRPGRRAHRRSCGGALPSKHCRRVDHHATRHTRCTRCCRRRRRALLVRIRSVVAASL